jgi:hypothetical protein
VRAYRASEEESLLARNLLKDWAGEGLINESQHRQLQQETVSELRCTNIFLRLVLFFFTFIIVGAALGLFFLMFLDRSPQETVGVALLAGSVVAYATAELAVSNARLYRYGIEEALLLSSIGFLGSGTYFALSNGSFLFSSGRSIAEFLAPAAAAIASLWIWHRFGLSYFSLLAMILAVLLPSYWTTSIVARLVTIAAIYLAALVALFTIRPRHSFTHLNQQYSIAEALLWLGIYLTFNLQITASYLVRGSVLTAVPRPFYWATWVVIWCLPPAILARGLRLKDRFVIAVGTIASLLTLVTNKDYLGGQHHSWDPMLLGAFLIALVLGIRHWLAQGPNEIRHGFTARRLSGKDKVWMSTATTALGFTSTNAITPAPQPASPEVKFGGGDSGGAGASADW